MKLYLWLAATSAILVVMPRHLEGQEWVVRHIEGVEYPRLAILAREEATISVRCELATDGIVTNAEVIDRRDEKRPGSVLEKAALENARKWRFRYTGLDTVARGYVTLVYTFRLTGTCDSGSCSSQFSYDFPNRVAVTAKYRPLDHN